MSVQFYRESPGKFDSRTLSREILSRWTGRNKQQTPRHAEDGGARAGSAGPDEPQGYIYIYIYIYISISITTLYWIL